MQSLKNVASEFEGLSVVERGTIRVSFNHPQMLKAKELLGPVLAEFAEDDGQGGLVVPKMTPETLLLSLLASANVDKARDLKKVTNLGEAIEGIFVSKRDDVHAGDVEGDGSARSNRGNKKKHSARTKR